MKKNVAAVIVTYNRKKKLLECINHLLDQESKLDKILIIDNDSTDGTEEYLYDIIKSNPEIQYINIKRNTGGAGGFYYGIKLVAKEEKFDFIWLMDDDGKPKDSKTLKNLLNAFERSNLETESCILNSVVLSLEDQKKLAFGLKGSGQTYQEILDHSKNGLVQGGNPFNGTLIPTSLIKKMGLPIKEFFIKGDEFEYILRAELHKAKIFTVIDSLFLHPPAEKSLCIFWGKKIIFLKEAPWKQYYRIRNYLFIYRKYRNLFGNQQWLIFLFRAFGVIILHHNSIIKRVKLVTQAIFDYKMNRFGKTLN